MNLSTEKKRVGKMDVNVKKEKKSSNRQKRKRERKKEIFTPFILSPEWLDKQKVNVPAAQGKETKGERRPLLETVCPASGHRPVSHTRLQGREELRPTLEDYMFSWCCIGCLEGVAGILTDTWTHPPSPSHWQIDTDRHTHPHGKKRSYRHTQTYR